MVEESIKGAFELKDSDLGVLDRLAQKAKATLDRARDAVAKEKTRGQGETPFAQFQDRVEKERKAGAAKPKKGQFIKSMETDLGTSKARVGISFFQNPTGFLTNMLTRQLPILGGLVAAKDIAIFIMKELTKKGGPLDRFFKNAATTLIDAARDKELTQSIRSGIGAQLIITTIAGTQSPRDAYNSFEQFNNNQEEFQAKFAIRVTDGL